MHAAVELARQLGPLPAALSTIARRVRRHHAHYGYPKDDTLGAELDGLEGDGPSTCGKR